jgi:hypothetical protein
MPHILDCKEISTIGRIQTIMMIKSPVNDPLGVPSFPVQ